MKKIIMAIAAKDVALFGVIIGSANGWGWLTTISGFAYGAGMILLIFALDAIEVFLKPIKRYSRKVDRVAEDQKDEAAFRELRDKTIDRKLKEMDKRSGQHIKGFIRSGGEIINFERKEA